MKEPFEEKTLHRETIYEGQVITLVVDDVLLPNQDTSKRELVFHQGAVGILAITEEDKIVLVKQYRKALETSLIEIPAGKIERDETEPVETAKRELEEETMYQCEEMTYMMKFVGSPGFCNEWLHLYRAKGLKRVDNPLPRDDDEFLELLELTLEEATEAVATGKICDAKTVIAITQWEIEELKKG